MLCTIFSLLSLSLDTWNFSFKNVANEIIKSDLICFCLFSLLHVHFFFLFHDLQYNDEAHKFGKRWRKKEERNRNQGTKKIVNEFSMNDGESMRRSSVLLKLFALIPRCFTLFFSLSLSLSLVLFGIRD